MSSAKREEYRQVAEQIDREEKDEIIARGKVAELPDLVELHLDHCAYVTDAGVAHLRRCPRLQQLYISGTQVSAALRNQLDATATVVVRVRGAYGHTAQWRVSRDVRLECFVKLESHDAPFADYDHKTIDWDHRNVRIRYFRGSGSGVVMLRGQSYRNQVEMLCVGGQEIETPANSRVVIQPEKQPIVTMYGVSKAPDANTRRETTRGNPTHGSSRSIRWAARAERWVSFSQSLHRNLRRDPAHWARLGIVQGGSTSCQSRLSPAAPPR